MNLVERTLSRVHRVQAAHPLLVIAASLALAGLAALYTFVRLDFRTSQRDLISPSNRFVKLSKQLDRFDKLDGFVVAIEARDPGRSLAFLRALAERLEADRASYAQVFYRVDPEHFRPWGLLYLEKEELESLVAKLHEHKGLIEAVSKSPTLPTFLGEVNREMTLGLVGELFTGFLGEEKKDGDETLDLGFLTGVLEQMQHWAEGGTAYASPWQSFFGENGLISDSEDGYFWTEGKRYLLLFATPREADDGFTSAEGSLKALRAAIGELKKEFSGVEAGVTGPVALNTDEMGMALGDMSVATGLSLGGLAVLLVLFWRGVRRPITELVTLVLALSWTFGFTTLVVGHLNILSVTFAPMLLGLGVDYGVHWFARFQEEAQWRGAPRQEAVRTTMVQLGPAILLAGCTAALSFFPLVLTGFKGLVELGIITSMGMVLATVATLGTLPALVLVFDRASPGVRPVLAPAAPARVLFRLTTGRAAAILAVGVAGLGGSLWAARDLAFDLNMLKLQSKGAESVVWEEKLLQDSKRSSLYGALFAHSRDEVREKSRKLEALPTVSEVMSAESFLPADQQEKLPFLRRIEPDLAGVGPIAEPKRPVAWEDLGPVLGKVRFKVAESSDAGEVLAGQMKRARLAIDGLREHFRVDRAGAEEGLRRFERELFRDLGRKLSLLTAGVHASPMGLADLPASLRERFVGPGDLFLIRAFAAEDIWEPEALGRFVRGLRSVDPDAIGDPVTLEMFTREYRDACVKAAVYAVLFIFGLLLVTLRRVSDTLAAIAPLAVGTAWTVGLMRLLGIQFNLANSLFLPLVVGAGVEYGIIFVQRWRQTSQTGGNVVLPLSTTMGIALAGLTTTVGFGSLAISAHQGIHSLGVLAAVGSLAILVAAIFFLPAALYFATNRSRSGRSEGGEEVEPDEEARRIPAR